MANLSSIEKLKIEKLFDMGTGYVLDLSNRTFSEFILENTGLDIYDSKYNYASGSKANRLRAFWQRESNQVVGRLILKLLEYWKTKKDIDNFAITPEQQKLYDECVKIAERLLEENLEECSKRALQVFLCHSSSDKPAVEKFYDRLINDGINAWLDKKNLIPGQNWQIEIPKVVKSSDVVIVFLSSSSITKEGFVQKEIKIALDTADEKPDGTIFIIPAKLEKCEIPERLAKFQWVDLFENDGYALLFKSLQLRASNLGVIIGN